MMLKQEKTEGMPRIISAFGLDSLKSFRMDKEGNADQFQQSAVQVEGSAEQSVEQSAERTTTIWTWVKANPIEVFVMSTLFVAMIFSLITFAADKKGYWGGKYEQLTQTLELTFGYRYYTYDYEYIYRNESTGCKTQVTYNDKDLHDIPLGEIPLALQSVHASSAFLALLIIVARMLAFGDRLPEVLDKVVLHYFTAGASSILVILQIVFFSFMPYEIKKWLRDNDGGFPICVALDSNVLYSSWATNLTIIVIGVWISTIVILFNYPFWGTQDEDESPTLLIEQSRKTLGGTVPDSSMDQSINRSLRPPAPLRTSQYSSSYRRY